MKKSLAFPLKEYEARWARVHEEMRRLGYELALVWGKSGFSYEHAMDVLYLTNYASSQEHERDQPGFWNARSFAAVILKPGEPPELHTDEAEPQEALIATDRVFGHDDVVAGVAEALKERNASRVVLVGENFLPAKYFRELVQGVPNVAFTIEDDLIARVRRIKSPRELDAFREGGAIATAGLNALIEALIQGETEAEAAARAAYQILRRGGAFHALPCCHGEMTRYFTIDPLTGYSRTAPEPGDLVRGWVFGPIYKGYWLDPGRSAVCQGREAPAQRRLVADCARIIEAVLGAVRAGVSVREVALLGRRLHEEAGGEPDQSGAIWPYFGHGNGSMWEPPFLHPELCGADEVFEENMVASAETFLYRAGVGSAGIETNYIVGKEGVEVITPSPLLWW